MGPSETPDPRLEEIARQFDLDYNGSPILWELTDRAGTLAVSYLTGNGESGHIEVDICIPTDDHLKNGEEWSHLPSLHQALQDRAAYFAKQIPIVRRRDHTYSFGLIAQFVVDIENVGDLPRILTAAGYTSGQPVYIRKDTATASR